jgi:phosphatidate cytidylyltransferase
MGAVLIALVAGVLWLDQRFAPWYPFLFVFVLLLALAGCYELLQLLPVERRPRDWLCILGTAAVLIANWATRVADPPAEPWLFIAGDLAMVTLLAFLVEMALFREPGHSVLRVALTVWIVAYLGLLPSFFVQLRWLAPERAQAALALAIFVPKGCDIGAYFTGRLLGKHKMTPVLSPKKTWEGLAGGLVVAIAVAVALNRLGAGLSDLAAVGFGLTVGTAGVFGDLAESLIKRDCQRKDASQIMPGFGGVLDVVDSIIFAAPVAYAWLRGS